MIKFDKTKLILNKKEDYITLETVRTGHSTI